jgi:hypothetical protein
MTQGNASNKGLKYYSMSTYGMKQKTSALSLY